MVPTPAQSEVAARFISLDRNHPRHFGWSLKPWWLDRHGFQPVQVVPNRAPAEVRAFRQLRFTLPVGRGLRGCAGLGTSVSNIAQCLIMFQLFPLHYNMFKQTNHEWSRRAMIILKEGWKGVDVSKGSNHQPFIHGCFKPPSPATPWIPGHSPDGLCIFGPPGCIWQPGGYFPRNNYVVEPQITMEPPTTLGSKWPVVCLSVPPQNNLFANKVWHSML